MGIEPTTSRSYNHTSCRYALFLLIFFLYYNVLIVESDCVCEWNNVGLYPTALWAMIIFKYFSFLVLLDKERRRVPPLKYGDTTCYSPCPLRNGIAGFSYFFVIRVFFCVGL